MKKPICLDVQNREVCSALAFSIWRIINASLLKYQQIEATEYFVWIKKKWDFFFRTIPVIHFIAWATQREIICLFVILANYTWLNYVSLSWHILILFEYLPYSIRVENKETIDIPLGLTIWHLPGWKENKKCYEEISGVYDICLAIELMD